MISPRFPKTAVARLALLLAIPALASADEARRAATLGSETLGFRGHWTLEIVNPDGTLDRVLEFDNRFTGQRVVSSLLGGRTTPGEWLIFLVSSGPVGPCGDESMDYACLIVGPGHSGLPAYYTESLIVETDEGDPPGSEAWIELTGDAVMRRDGSLAAVEVFLETCGPETTPDQCAAPTETPRLEDRSTLKMARKSLEALEPVKSGQRVVVTARFTLPSQPAE